MCTWVCVFVCSGYMQRSEVNIKYFPQSLSILVFETESLSGPGAYWWWPASISISDPLVPASLMLRPQAHALHVCGRYFGTEQCSQIICFYVLVIKKRKGEGFLVFSVTGSWIRTPIEMLFVPWHWSCRAIIIYLDILRRNNRGQVTGDASHPALMATGRTHILNHHPGVVLRTIIKKNKSCQE